MLRFLAVVAQFQSACPLKITLKSWRFHIVDRTPTRLDQSPLIPCNRCEFHTKFFLISEYFPTSISHSTRLDVHDLSPSMPYVRALLLPTTTRRARRLSTGRPPLPAAFPATSAFAEPSLLTRTSPVAPQPCMNTSVRGHRSPKNMQTPLPWDASEIRAALDKPASYYHAYARRPAVAAALAQFRSERDVHQTERLDLVTWVQYICGFGCTGPSEDAWTQLFHACRLQEGLGGASGEAPADLSAGDFLREHEIAVLLAHAKVSPESADTMTHATLIKHRIRPAVFGRNDARTPGIIRHVSSKYEDWIFGYMTKWMCHYIVEEFSPRDFVPAFADLSLFATNVHNIRNCADTHATKNVKDWAVVIMQLLEIDHNTLSPRAAKFELKLQETRIFLFLQFYTKISEFFLTTLQVSAAAFAADSANVSADSDSSSCGAPIKSESVLSSGAGNARTQDTLLYAAIAAARGYHASPSLTAPAYATIKALCGLRAATSLGTDVMEDIMASADGGRTSGGPI